MEVRSSKRRPYFLAYGTSPMVDRKEMTALLRELAKFDILAYCEDDPGVIDMVESNLFKTLGRIAEICEENGAEWCLQSEGRKKQTASKAKLPARVIWIFSASESTYDTILAMFDETEDMNLTTYYIDRY